VGRTGSRGLDATMSGESTLGAFRRKDSSSSSPLARRKLAACGGIEEATVSCMLGTSLAWKKEPPACCNGGPTLGVTVGVCGLPILPRSRPFASRGPRHTALFSVAALTPTTGLARLLSGVFVPSLVGFRVGREAEPVGVD